MESWLPNLLSALLVAAISGLAFLAYKHPEGFEPIYTILHRTSMAVFVAVNGWNGAVTYIYSELYFSIPTDIRYIKETTRITDSMQATRDGLELPFLYIMAIFLIFETYLLLLVSLPYLTNSKNKKSDENDKEDKT